MEKVKLTAKEFVKRGGKEKFKRDGYTYYVDYNHCNPFRIANEKRTDNMGITSSWNDFNGINEFEVVKEKVIERRWKYLQNFDGETKPSLCYCNNEKAAIHGFLKKGWHKDENDFIDVEVEK